MRTCVFCGSSNSIDECYREAAKALGRSLAREGCDLIYGGASVGLMGVIADTMLAEKREVIGIITEDLYSLEIGHKGITKLLSTKTMAERKKMLVAMSDAFIVMPGGVGTLDELFEVFVLNQLMHISKPVIIYNVYHYYDKLFEFLQEAVDKGFLPEKHFNSLIVSNDPNFIADAVFFKPQQFISK